MIRRMGIASKPDRADIPALLRFLADWGARHGVETVLDETSAAYLDRKDGKDRHQLPDGCDLLVVLGGDGTLLSAARAVGDRQTPLLAVNLGGLGFMMTTGPDELPAAIEDVAQGAYELDSRLVLEALLERGGRVVERYFALNDIVVANGIVARLMHLEAYADDEYVCAYRSDGLILSTPTGSTAYSLSAGGPVMAPDVAALCLTPICPHTLSNRSVVLPVASKVEIRIAGGDAGNYLSIDGQVGRGLEAGDRVRAWRASHTVDIVQTKGMRYFELLRNKMDWGDP